MLGVADRLKVQMEHSVQQFLLGDQANTVGAARIVSGRTMLMCHCCLHIGSDSVTDECV